MANAYLTIEAPAACRECQIAFMHEVEGSGQPYNYGCGYTNIDVTDYTDRRHEQCPLLIFPNFPNYAEFTIEKETPEYIFIKDIGHTHTKTVTNDADNVIKYLKVIYKLGDRRVFYKDSEGQIDELLHTAGKFTGYKAGHAGIELGEA